MHTMPISTSNSARPISSVLWRLRIMARMSVPPVDAPMSNTMALPIAGKITAKHRSSHISPVMDVVDAPGNSISNRDT
ncbi:Uncharacterised protein [Collinsella intestinalis]|nr:Uncharacterised protein [Collinsella intestinalis]